MKIGEEEEKTTTDNSYQPLAEKDDILAEDNNMIESQEIV